MGLLKVADASETSVTEAAPHYTCNFEKRWDRAPFNLWIRMDCVAVT